MLEWVLSTHTRPSNKNSPMTALEGLANQRSAPLSKLDLGLYHFDPAGLRLAKQTLANFIEKASRLYEHEREEPDGSSELRRYLTRWLRWARAGLTAEPTDGGIIWTDNPAPELRGLPPPARQKCQPQEAGGE